MPISKVKWQLFSLIKARCIGSDKKIRGYVRIHYTGHFHLKRERVMRVPCLEKRKSSGGSSFIGERSILNYKGVRNKTKIMMMEMEMEVEVPRALSPLLLWTHSRHHLLIHR